MALNLTPQQLQQIESLDIKITSKKSTLLPLLSISGLTVISFGGIFLLKSKLSTTVIPTPGLPLRSSPSEVGPTQVPKSIQHYLLTSQQFFTQALQLQQQKSPDTVKYLNQSILAASDAIKQFPNDYRGYEQRGRIYQALIDSQPQLLTTVIADFSAAVALNPSSAALTRSLAGLYARQGDSRSTLNYLTRTVDLDPTTAQNFYDLARLEQQLGLIPQALSTYDRLLTIVSDPTQKAAVTTERSALEKLASQNPDVRVDPRIDPSGSALPSFSPSVSPVTDGPLIQADSGTGLIIAAPETSANITVNNLSISNSLSGDGLIPVGSTQITLTNTTLAPSDQIYVTLISGGKNLNLQLLSRSGSTFTVGLDSPAPENITFKWWIVK